MTNPTSTQPSNIVNNRKCTDTNNNTINNRNNINNNDNGNNITNGNIIRNIKTCTQNNNITIYTTT